MADKLWYQILANGTDISGKLKQASVVANANEYSNAQVDLVNDGFTLDTNVQPGKTLLIYGSTDGGVTTATLFSGEIGDAKLEQDNNGKETFIIKGLGGAGFRNMHVSPNQVMLGPCDLGSALTGSPTDRNSVSWVTDSKGNYPNGLLYHTGYALTPDSVTDVFTGSYDISSKVNFTGKTLFDAFKYLTDLFTLTYIMNDVVGSFSVRKDPIYVNYPTASFTLSFRDMRSSFDVERDTREKYDRVTVVGSSSDNFFTIGSGTTEHKIIDSNLIDRNMVINKAKQQWAMRQLTRSYISITCVPITYSLVGKRITIDDDSRYGLASYGNVSGMTHTLTKDRWDTVLKVEEQRNITEAKLFSEIQSQLKNEANSGLGEIYLDGTANRNYLVSNAPVVAIGIGTSGASASSCTLSGGVAIRPLKAVVQDLSTGEDYIYVTLPTSDIRARLREVSLLTAATSSHTPPTASQIVSASRASYSSGNVITMATLSGAYPFQVGQYVPVNNQTESYYWWRARDIKVAKVYYGTVSADTPSPTAFRAGTTASGFYDISASDLLRLSVDNIGAESVSTNYLHFTASNKDIFVYLEIDTGFSPRNKQGIVWGKTEVVAWAPYVSTSAQCYVWNESGSPVPRWSLTAASPSVPIPCTSPYYTEYQNLTATTSGYIDDDGRLKVLIGVGRLASLPGPVTYSGNVEYNLEFVSQLIKFNPAYMQPNGLGTQQIVEWVQYDPATEAFYPSQPVTTLKNIWITGSFNSTTSEWTPIGDPIFVETAVDTADGGRAYGAGAFYGFPGANIVPLSAVQLENAQYAIRGTKKVMHVMSGRIGEWVYVDATLGYRPVRETLNEQKGALMQYITCFQQSAEPVPNTPTVDISNCRLTYSNAALRTASVQMVLNNSMPPYGVPYDVKYAYCVAPIARYTVSGGRIDQGIGMDGASEVNVLLKLNTASSGSGYGSISGLGCADP